MNRPDAAVGIVLSLNVGSSSVKFSLHRLRSGALQEIGSGTVDRQHGKGTVSFDYADASTPDIHERPFAGRVSTALQDIAEEEGRIIGIGHRLVHGGLSICDHVRLSAQVMATLERAVPFAPLHLPPALELIRECFNTFSDIPQVGCLDTAFHKALPPVAATLPLPKAIRDFGVRRFGFHGLSCESVVEQLKQTPARRLVVAHLGGGSSLTAIADGRSVDTSMGLTPMGGIMMSHRPGDLDPGILFYLLREKHYEADTLENLLEHEAGISGVSPAHADMRSLQSAVQRGEVDATLAFDMFVRSVARQVAGMCVVLGGIDLLVFTGGVGENATAVRERVVELLAPVLGQPNVMVLPSRENERIAFHTARLMQA